MKEFKYTNSFNDTLKGNFWAIEKPKAIIVLVTGMAEHSSRYDDFATFLNKNGYSVYCLDHYGQGKNEGQGKGAEDFFSKMVKTVDELVLKYKEEFKLPVYIFSHSMGSFMTQSYLENYTHADKYVICGTNFMKGLGGISYTLAKCVVNKKNIDEPAKLLHDLAIGAYEKTAKGYPSNNAWLSYNEENWKKYDADPDSGYRCSNGFYLNFFKGLASLNKNKLVEKIDKSLPIYIIAGQDDPVGGNGSGPTKLQKYYEKFGLNSKLKIYNHMKHEILNEDDHNIVYQDVLDFYNA